MQFTPLKNFFSDELRSGYEVGLSYTVRAIPPNPAIPGDKGTALEDTKLAKLLPTWIKEGKVRLGAPDAPIESAKVSGAGKVT